MKTKACGATFKGNVRNHNEDNLFVDGQFKDNTSSNIFLAESKRENGPFLYAVFDGLGGEMYGEEASLIAAKMLSDAGCSDNNDNLDINEFISRADREIRARAEELGVRTMGTTAAIVYIQDNKVAAYNVGDSRVYLFREDKIKQLSKDHSIVQSMIDMGFLTEEDRYSNSHAGELTQYLGMSTEEEVEPSSDVCEIELVPDDILLLCSDGLNAEISDSTIEKMLERSKEMDPSIIATDLLMTAKEGRCTDNVTVVIIKCE